VDVADAESLHLSNTKWMPRPSSPTSRPKSRNTNNRGAPKRKANREVKPETIMSAAAIKTAVEISRMGI
jgi:hypothetical protein